MELHACHGPLFSGMLVYLSEMDRRMEGKLLLPYSLQSLVACKFLIAIFAFLLTDDPVGKLIYAFKYLC